MQPNLPFGQLQANEAVTAAPPDAAAQQKQKPTIIRMQATSSKPAAPVFALVAALARQDCVSECHPWCTPDTCLEQWCQLVGQICRRDGCAASCSFGSFMIHEQYCQMHADMNCAM